MASWINRPDIYEQIRKANRLSPHGPLRRIPTEEDIHNLIRRARNGILHADKAARPTTRGG